MNTKKRFLLPLILIVAALMAILCACGGGGGSETDGPNALHVTVPEGKLVLRNGGTATVRVTSDNPLNEDKYVWESSNESIGTVEYQGKVARVTATGRGECTITVTNGKYEASFTLVVGLT